jgi:hypothetical protein
MQQGMTTLSDPNFGARRARQVRARRWRRGLRTAGLLLLMAAVPVLVALLLSGRSDPTSSTTVPQSAEVLVRSFDGTGSSSTGVFVVDDDWVLKWQLDGLGSDSIQIVVREAGGGVLETVIQEGLGAGEQAFPEGGAYRLVITSTGDWNIRVLQLSGPLDT